MFEINFLNGNFSISFTNEKKNAKEILKQAKTNIKIKIIKQNELRMKWKKTCLKEREISQVDAWKLFHLKA